MRYCAIGWTFRADSLTSIVAEINVEALADAGPAWEVPSEVGQPFCNVGARGFQSLAPSRR